MSAADQRPPCAPGSTLAQCCLDAQASGVVVNRRPWPGWGMDLAECPACHSSISMPSSEEEAQQERAA